MKVFYYVSEILNSLILFKTEKFYPDLGPVPIAGTVAPNSTSYRIIFKDIHVLDSIGDEENEKVFELKILEDGQFSILGGLPSRSLVSNMRTSEPLFQEQTKDGDQDDDDSARLFFKLKYQNKKTIL